MNNVRNWQTLNNQTNSQKNLIYNNIKYVKPVYFIGQQQKRVQNLYYDNNPYSLNTDLVNRNSKGIYNINNSRYFNASKDLSETSSQRSSKVVRANGLKLAEKPKILSNSNISKLGFRQLSSSQARLSDQSGTFEKNLHLQQQNRILREQNRRLKQSLRQIRQGHGREVIQLNIKFDKLMQQLNHLQTKVQTQHNQWKRTNTTYNYQK